MCSDVAKVGDAEFQLNGDFFVLEKVIVTRPRMLFSLQQYLNAIFYTPS